MYLGRTLTNPKDDSKATIEVKLSSGDTITATYIMPIDRDTRQSKPNITIGTSVLVNELEGIYYIVGSIPIQDEMQPKKQTIIENDDRVALKSDKVDIELESGISIKNESDDLIALLDEVVKELSIMTTPTIGGLTPPSNMAKFKALSEKISKFKE